MLLPSRRQRHRSKLKPLINPVFNESCTFNRIEPGNINTMDNFLKSISIDKKLHRFHHLFFIFSSSMANKQISPTLGSFEAIKTYKYVIFKYYLRPHLNDRLCGYTFFTHTGFITCIKKVI